MRKFSVATTASMILLVLIWGLCWHIYKVSLAYTPPLLFAGMRALIGGLLLSVFLLPRWRSINWRKNWPKYSISALLNIVFNYGCQTAGLTYLPGGLISVLVYFQPVLIGLFSWMWLGERMSVLKVAGLIIGFLGVLAVSIDGITGQVSIIGVILALITAISWTLGVIYVKKERDNVDSLWMVAFQCIIGGAVLLGLGSGTESWSNITWNTTYLVGLGFGVTFGVPIAFVIYYKLVNEGDASKVASFTFLVPLIAVVTGAVFMKEPLTYSLLTGLILIVASIYCVNYPGRKVEKPLPAKITYGS